MFAQVRMMEIMEDSKSFEILRNAFEQQLINDGFVEHSGYSLEKDYINAYIDERVECAWFACLQGYRLAKAQAVPEGFVLVDKHQLAQLMANMDSFGKKALGDDYVSFADIAAVLDEAQEPTND